MSTSQAIEIDLAEASRISLKSIFELMGKQISGRDSLGYMKQDQKNYTRVTRQKKGHMEKQDVC